MESQPRSSRLYCRARRLILALGGALLLLALVFFAALAFTQRAHAQVFPSPTPTPRFSIEIPGELPPASAATPTRSASPSPTSSPTPAPDSDAVATLLATLAPTRAPTRATVAAPTAVLLPGLTPATTPTPAAYIYLPAVTGGVAEVTRTARPVFGLTGKVGLSATTDAEMITLPTGRVLWLVPATPAIEDELAPLARRQPAPSIKVWGTLYEDGADDPLAYVVVTDILDNTARPTVAPVATRATPPSPQPVLATGRFDAVNLRAAPNTNAARTGRIELGQACTVSARTAEGAWISLRCPGGASGWIEPRFVTLSDNLEDVPVGEGEWRPAPTPAPEVAGLPTQLPTRVSVPLAMVFPTPLPTAMPLPPPVPTPTSIPYAFQGWRTLYFANPNLGGVPALVDDSPSINYDWGQGPPRPGLPADYFSIAWERTIDFTNGFYILTASADDGFRVLIDNVVVMDQWLMPVPQGLRIGRALGGKHDVRVEYYDVAGAARVQFGYVLQPPPLHWAASYASLPTVPTGLLTQMEADAGAYRLDYNWGAGSPSTAPGDNWSARWVADYYFAAGTYLFQAQGIDGYRVSLDGQVIIDKWRDGYEEQRNRFIGVGEGNHTVAVDYYNRVGPASIRVWWTFDSSTGAGPR